MGATGAATFQPISASSAAPSLFHALLAQRLTVSAPTPAPARMEMTLDERRRAELANINRGINHAIRPARDIDVYGEDEYWTRPILANGRRAQGDCEDYALEKRAALLAAGWPAETLALAIAVSPRVGLHAVLIAQTNEGDYVLDNLYDRPRRLGELDYGWISRQAGASLSEWRSAHVTGESAERRQLRGPRGGEALFAELLDARARQARGAALERAASPQDEAVSANVESAREPQLAPMAPELALAEPKPLRAPVLYSKGAALAATLRLARIQIAP